ncbi:hypothetical protein G7Y89_g1253 [Cudoniella acicularis]|uniref:Uncharacterized protein n=1 Tax=Cudoniella acicularis TaxID=354080 RepID=A0A8H4W769_9HELO|nr:hypothetical protein G7Y89_g1253 [Cudoniella acicularis]
MFSRHFSSVQKLFLIVREGETTGVNHKRLIRVIVKTELKKPRRQYLEDVRQYQESFGRSFVAYTSIPEIKYLTLAELKAQLGGAEEVRVFKSWNATP